MSSIPENNRSLFDLKALKELGGLKVGDFLAVDPELYQKFMAHIGLTVKRDKVTSNLVFLTGLSCYTPEPINTFLRGESSIGKSYNAVNILKYFPKDDVWLLGGLSPTALVHDRGLLVDKNGEPILPSDKPDKDAAPEEKEEYRKKMKDAHYLVDLQGKVLVFLEAPNIETFNKLRPILSHDTYEISYRFTDKSAKGQLQATHVVIRGWPATVFCSTSEKFVQDLATRSFTYTPETTEAKYKDANVLTGTKAAFPWKFEKDFDFMLLEGYLRFFKNHMEELRAIIPYATAFATTFPSKFPRAMRDFKHLLGLIQVKALFYLAQRPILLRKVRFEVEGKDPATPEYREEQQTYVMAVKEDYDFVMGIWQEIRETTETSAAGHVITFYHKVVEDVAKKAAAFTVNDLTDAWNAKFPDRKSSDTIRKWVDFLCEIGYMTKEPSSLDKRQNLLKIIEKERNGNYTQNDLSVFFTPDSFKAWLNDAKQITASNQILLRENLVSEAEATPEEIFREYFLSKKQENAVNSSSISKGSFLESGEEKADKSQIVQFPNFQIEVKDIESIIRIEGPTPGVCGKCQQKAILYWTLKTFSGAWTDLCQGCGVDLTNQKRKEVEQA